MLKLYHIKVTFDSRLLSDSGKIFFMNNKKILISIIFYINPYYYLYFFIFHRLNYKASGSLKLKDISNRSIGTKEIKEMTSRKIDLDLCVDVKAEKKDECYLALSQKNNDIDLCENIGDLTTQDSCFNFFALNSKIFYCVQK